MKRRALSTLLAMGLVLSVFVGVFGSAGASHNEFDGPEIVGDASSAHAYFPFVANGEELDGVGPMYGTVTVQNLEDRAAMVDIYVGGELERSDVLQPYASTTYSADQLGVASPGESVAAYGYLHRGAEAGDVQDACVVTVDDDDVETYFGISEEMCEAIGDVEDVDADFVPDFEVDEGVNAEYARIAGALKQVGPEASADGKTTSSHETVGGYSALTGDQVEDPTGNYDYVQPIVQTNDGWNTVLRLAAFGGDTGYTVTLYAAAGQGAAGGSSGSFTGSLSEGETVSLDIGDQVPEGWVGTAFISTNGPAGAVVDRYKPSESMLINNVSRPQGQDAGEQYAALVFQDYNFWNTGISVANTSDSSITVTIDYQGATGTVPDPEQITIPGRGMEYVYHAGGQDLGLNGFVGSAVLSGDGPFQASVDQVKYFGNDPDVGQAMSYVTTDDVAGHQAGFEGDLLAAPLVQKGNPATDTGDTSGIQLFNTDNDDSVTANIWFVDRTGNLVAPTLNAPMSIDLTANESRTIYTHQLSEMPAGFQGSVVVAVEGDGSLVGVTNNVNYEVQADGSAAFNLVPVPGEQLYDLTLEPDYADNDFYGDDVLTRWQAQQVSEIFLPYFFDVAGPLPPEVEEYIAMFFTELMYEELSEFTDEEYQDFVENFSTGFDVSAEDEQTLLDIWFDHGLNEHTVTATVAGEGAVEDVDVEFEVTGANQETYTETTDENGVATFTYQAAQAGNDTIVATASVDGRDLEAEAAKDWTPVESEASNLDVLVLNFSDGAEAFSAQSFTNERTRRPGLSDLSSILESASDDREDVMEYQGAGVRLIYRLEDDPQVRAPWAELLGRVTDQFGVGLEGEEVTFLHEDGQGGFVDLAAPAPPQQPELTATTDEMGYVDVDFVLEEQTAPVDEEVDITVTAHDHLEVMGTIHFLFGDR